MLAVKCTLSEAETARKRILKESCYDVTRLTVKDKGFIYFPITKKIKGLKFVNKNLPKRDSDKTFHSILGNTIPKKLLDEIPRALDIIGDIAIIELPENLDKYYSLTADAIMKANRQVKVVCRKAGFF